MLDANYTSENICRALGLGGFANDWQLAKAEEGIRVLLAPACHREICISVCRTAHMVSVSVVTALSQIWLQDWPVPQLAQVEQETGTFSALQFASLSSLLAAAAEPSLSPRIVIADGMRAHTVHRADREGKLNRDDNVGNDANYTVFVADVIKQSHGAIRSPGIRNALADAGNYVGLGIPLEVAPKAKDVVRTLVLGSRMETAQLIEALRKRHEA